MIVAKIGGSCLNNYNDLKEVIILVKRWLNKGETPILVISAFKGITDEIIQTQKEAINGTFDLSKISQRHKELIFELSSKTKTEAESKLNLMLSELNKLLLNVQEKKYADPVISDKIVVFGEKIATMIIVSYLEDNGIAAKTLWGHEAGIITNNNFGDGDILDQSKDRISEKFRSLNYVPVVAGYFGENQDGEIVTLGRGATDYIATFISASLKIPVILFKDVDGIMTADPKIVKTSQLIKKISYHDAIESSYFGLKAINEKAIIPAYKAGIPIKIINFNNPASDGTLITSQGNGTIISKRSNLIKLNLSKNRIDTITRFRSLLDEFLFDPIVFSKTSRSECYLILDEKDIVKAETKLKKHLDIKYEIENDIEVIAAIGKSIENYDIKKIFQELPNNIEVMDLIRAPYTRNIVIVTKKENTAKLMNLFHDLFLQ